MFEDVESLEKEVQTFRKNILASDELITVLQDLVNQGKEQATLFERASSELIQRIETQSLNTETQMKESVSSAVQAISEGNAKQLSSAQQQTESFQKAAEDLTSKTNEQLVNLEKTIQETVAESIKEINDANNRKIDEVSKKLISSHEESIAKIEAAHSVIERQLQEQNKRLDSIASKLESLDFTKVVNECQLIKKSVSTKFAILFAGVVISIGVALYSLFVK